MSSLQRTEEWRQARLGCLGASQVADALARTKTGWGASRANLMSDLIVERLTGIPTDGYVSPAMQYGIANEADARATYEFYRSSTVEEVGFILHPRIPMTGASPDGIVGSDGLVEFKVPNSATHLETLLGGGIPGKYVMQMQWQMACTERAWCDWVSFDPRMPEQHRLYVKRCNRDGHMIADLEKQVAEFLAEVDEKIARLGPSTPKADLQASLEPNILAAG